ncbi:MAG: class I SAM-dependent methyltransferase [Chloroflexota bacterium]
MDSCGCDGLEWMFDRRTAERDRVRYRQHGADRTTQMLVDMIRAVGVEGSTILDIGGGIGVIDPELLKAGASRATMVDVSQAYLDVAREGAAGADLLERIDFHHGDFVARAAETDPADIVTLDRVICCYGDADALVRLSSARAGRVYGLVLPRDRFLVRAAIRAYNLTLWLRRKAYRAYVHSNTAIDKLVAGNGLRRRSESRTFVWRVVVYERP